MKEFFDDILDVVILFLFHLSKIVFLPFYFTLFLLRDMVNALGKTFESCGSVLLAKMPEYEKADEYDA